MKREVCHTRFCRRLNALLAFDILFSASFAGVVSFVMMLPRYVNFCTTLVDVHQCGYWELRTETSALVGGLLLSFE